MNILKRVIVTCLVTVFLLATPIVVSAQNAGSGIQLGINKDPSVKITSLPKLLGGIIGAILIIAFIIALFFLFWGGIQWITSGGDKEGVEAAQKKIQAAIIGLIIVAAVWAIFSVVAQWLGFNIENLQLPNVQGN